MTIGAMTLLAGGGGIEGSAAPAVAPGAAGGFDAVMAAVAPGVPVAVAPASVVPESGATAAAALLSEAPSVIVTAGPQALPPVRPESDVAIAPGSDDSDGSGAAAQVRTPALAAHDPPASRPTGTAAAPSPDSTAPIAPDRGPRWATLRRVARPLPVEPPMPPAGAPVLQLPLATTPHRLPGAALGQSDPGRDGASVIEGRGATAAAEPGFAAPLGIDVAAVAKAGPANPAIGLMRSDMAATAPRPAARSGDADRGRASTEAPAAAPSDAAPLVAVMGAAAVTATAPAPLPPAPPTAPAVANAPSAASTMSSSPAWSSSERPAHPLRTAGRLSRRADPAICGDGPAGGGIQGGGQPARPADQDLDEFRQSLISFRPPRAVRCAAAASFR